MDYVHRRCLYQRALEHTQTVWEVHAIIEAFRNETTHRLRRTIPG